ncbi:MAG: hypothetical protein STSR0006_00920 [Lentimicrobium sp.]
MTYLLILISSFAIYLSDNSFFISEIYFYILIVITIFDYNKKKSITLFQFWQISFIYIILSEALLSTYSDIYFLKAIRYLILSNNILILGYLLFERINSNKKTINVNNYTKQKIYIETKNKFVPIFFVFIVLAYTSYQLPRSLITFLYGRSTAYDLDSGTESIIISSILGSIPLILPSIIVYYYKELNNTKTIFKPLILSIPIFIVLFVSGTRFPLLFSIVGFFIIAFSDKFNGRIKLNFKLISIGVLLLISTEVMTIVRVGGFESETIEVIKNNETRFSKIIASNMSPEGVIDMTSLMMKHFETNPHMYGKSSSFVLYFWIPRSVWPAKPTMLGHWLIRQYRGGFSNVHSASFGFTGDLFADFGYFSLLFVFLLGFLLKKIDLFFSNMLSKTGSYSKVLAAMLFPYVFFFVRSPITSTITFLGILFIYLLFKRIIFLKLKISN